MHFGTGHIEKFFADFTGDEGQDGKAADDGPIAPCRFDGPENRMQRSIQGKQEQQERNADADVHEFVAEQTDAEHRVVFRPSGKRPQQFGRNHGGKSEGSRHGQHFTGFLTAHHDVLGDGDVVQLQSVIVSAQDRERQNGALYADHDFHVLIEQRFRRVARVYRHHAGLRFFHAQCQRGESICDEIEP